MRFTPAVAGLTVGFGAALLQAFFGGPSASGLWDLHRLSHEGLGQLDLGASLSHLWPSWRDPQDARGPRLPLHTGTNHRGGPRGGVCGREGPWGVQVEGAQGRLAEAMD